MPSIWLDRLGVPVLFLSGLLYGGLALAQDPVKNPREGDPDAIIDKRGLRQISDEGAIEKIVGDAIAANAAIVAEYKAGKEKAFNSLVGKVMAASRGKANPAQVNAILKRKLAP